MSNRALGRYDRISDAVSPGPDLPRSARAMRGKVETVLAAVPDPTAIGKEKLQRQRAAVNRLTDTLEFERSCGRITEAAYMWGRAYMSVCEKASGGCSKPIYEPSDGAGDRHVAMVRKIEKVERVVRWDRRVALEVGQWSAFIVRSVLKDGMGFGELAASVGYKTNYGRNKVGKEFRKSIETLADSWGRK